jgi:trehalose-phosphatase
VLPHAAAIERAAVEIGRLARETRGVIVENKRWTLSVHYRLVDERFRPAVIALARQVAEHQQLRVTEGKMVVEVRPPVEINKGTASVALARRLHALAARAAILFAGDDRTDEDAFRELRAHMPNAVTIRVGPALPPHGGSSAEFTVPSPSELQDLLAWVAHRVGAPG